MPAFTTHYIFGEQTFHLLKNPEIKACIHKNPTVYSLGLQGPDPYFYYPPTHMPFLTNLGSLAHEEKTGLFFENMLIRRNKFKIPAERDIADAYIYGFLGHYALDTNAHPYIYFRTKYEKHDTAYDGRHMGLESDIDADILLLFKKKVPTQFCHPATIHITPLQKHVIATLLRYTFHHTYPQETKRHLPMAGPLHSVQVAARILWDPKDRTKKILAHFERVFLGHSFLSGMIMSKTGARYYNDPMNLRKKTWRNPWNNSITSNASFLELFQKAEEDHLTYMDVAFQTLHNADSGNPLSFQLFRETIGHRSYHSGLDV